MKSLSIWTATAMAVFNAYGQPLQPMAVQVKSDARTYLYGGQARVEGEIKRQGGDNFAGHVMDVVSTDQHTVKPWFNGKLDFSPPVKDLAAQELPLVGGRLDYLGGRSVAALVFQRHKHIINLFVWPAKENGSKPTSVTPSQGYNLIHWSEAKMAFWAVSDLNAKELMEFVQDFATGKTVNP